MTLEGPFQPQLFYNSMNHCGNKHNVNYIDRFVTVQKENYHQPCTYPSDTTLP